ncbi:MAG: tetratricopeptide repeat protein [Candidatus Aminicenantes bacterium]|nr:tetratricopeptide repeat protein [Candidatus Aminicenantes bacterium]
MKKDILHNLYLEYFGKYRKKGDAILFVRSILDKAKIEKSEAYIQCANGSLSLLEGDYEKANDFFIRAIGNDGDFVAAYYELASIAFEQKKYRGAEAYYKKALEIDNHFASAWNKLGVIYSIRKKYEKAEFFLKKSLELDSNNANPWNNLGVICADKKDFSGAMRNYEKAMEIDPTSPHPYTNIGILYANKKKFKEAEEYLKKAIEADGERSSQWDYLGFLYYEQGKDADAERCYLKALQLDENFPSPYFNIGWLLIKEKKYEEARKYFKRALDLYKKKKDKHGIRAAKYHVKKLKKAIKIAVEQEEKQTLSADMFLGAVKLYFILACIAAIIMAGSALYGTLFGWTSSVIDCFERSLMFSAFMFAAFALYYFIYRNRDNIPKSLHVLGNSLWWIYVRLFSPWSILAVGLFAVSKMYLNFFELLIGYVAVILITILIFYLSDSLLFFKIVKQAGLQKYNFPKPGNRREHTLKMAHISDIHTSGARGGITNDGKRFSPSHLKEKFDRLTQLEWDALILTGDMTDAGEQADWELFDKCTGDLSARGPVILVPGNHDIILSERLWVDSVGEQIQLKICRFLEHLNTLITPEFISIRRKSGEFISSRELLNQEMPFIEEYLNNPPVFYGNRDMDVSTKDSGMGVSVDEGKEFRRPQRILEDLYPLALPLKEDFLLVALDSLQHEESSQFIIENAIGLIRKDQIERLKQMVKKIEPKCLIIALHHQPGVLKKSILKLALGLIDSIGFLKVCESLNCRLILSGHIHQRHFSKTRHIPVFCSGASITYSDSFPIYTIDKDYHLSKEVIYI